MLLALSAGCASDERIHAFGSVADETDVITVPALTIPAVADVIGTPGPQAGRLASEQLGSQPYATPTGTPSPEPTRTPLPQQAPPDRSFGEAGTGSPDTTGGEPTYVRVTAVEVGVGDEVTAGQVLARLDDRALAITTAGAKAEAATAAAQPGVIGARIDEVTDREREARDRRAEVAGTLADLRDRRAQVQSTLADLRSTRSEVSGTVSDLRARRATLAEQLGQARTVAEQLRAAPPVIPPQGPLPGQSAPREPGAPGRRSNGTPPSPQQMQQNIARMEAGLAQMDGGIARAEAGLSRLDQGIRRAADGLDRHDEGIATGTDALATLDDVLEALAQGKQTLQGMRTVAEASVPVANAAVTLAEHRQSLAVVTAPAPGHVVEIVDAGSALPSGAPLATLRPASSIAAPVVTTWLDPEEAGRVCVDGTAGVGGDWASTSTPARISYIAPTAEYPPSEVATDQVHLLRAIRVDVTAEGPLPAGAPADVRFDPCGADATGSGPATESPGGTPADDGTDSPDPDPSAPDTADREGDAAESSDNGEAASANRDAGTTDAGGTHAGTSKDGATIGTDRTATTAPANPPPTDLPNR